ncbi:hypothetical protein D3C78_1550610 [compost metagenome]
MEGHALLAMHDLAARGAGARVGEPGAGVAQHGAHGRHAAQALFIHIGQFARVAGVFAKAQAQRIEHGVPVRVGRGLFGEHPVLQIVELKRHGGNDQMASQDSTSLVRSSGVKLERNAGASVSARRSTVQPSPRCRVRTGRVWLYR